jgi:hypothetical protein
MRGTSHSLAAAAVILLLPSFALAQGTLAGSVRDASGAVLPGVTVEASSPALIERVRVVVTDGTGQYRIVDLRPGTYALTFKMEGFSTVVREGIELVGSATLTVPVDMRLGSIEETITVLGETPVVDVQSTVREVVLTGDIIQTLPATRTYGALLNAIPGLTVAGAVSAQTTPEMTFFTAHGGPINEGRVTINGMNVAAAFNGGGVSSFTYDVANIEELQVRVSGGLGEAETGGPSMNLVPRSGGNRFAGSGFWSGAGDWSRGENIDDALRSIGITRGPALITSRDVSLSYGGPIRRDRLWFYGTVRNYETARAVEGAFANGYAGDPSRWNYLLDDTVEARNVQGRNSFSVRLTGQVTPRHRVMFSQENQYRCEGSTLQPGSSGCRSRGTNWIGMGTLGNSPEAHANYFDFPYYVTQATWSSPMTNRILLEAGFSRFYYRHGGGPGQVSPDGIMDLIRVTEQQAIEGHRANFNYRGMFTYLDNMANPTNWRTSAAYVTGSHNMKVGYEGAYQRADGTVRTNQHLMAYRFNNGVPNQFTFRLPNWQTSNRTMVHSVYVQDQWTRGQLTLQGALRFDHAHSWSPAEGNGTMDVSRFNPDPITFERTVSVRGYNDWSPRVGVAYDLFGTGKTAVKANIGRYMAAATNDGNFVRNNPANRIVTQVSRNWVDGNGNREVDCDILNPAAQNNLASGGDNCGQLTGNNLNFANAATGLTEINQDILGGRGVRPHDWQFGVSVQHEVLPRVSVDVGYNRRAWSNFFVTYNTRRGPEDYEPWSFTAPLDPRLPGGGGYEITQYTVTQEAASRGTQNRVTFETDFGPARTDYWHGFDVTGNARIRNGLRFQGGTSTGRGVTDRCASVVNINDPNPRNCRVVQPFRTTFRGLASYTIPRVDVLASASMRSLPGPQLNAFYLVPNTIVQQQLGRLPPGATINGNQNVNLLDSAQMYAKQRLSQVDVRFAKIVRLRGTRTDLGVDLYNLFNTNTVVGYDGQYGDGTTWLLPTTIVQPRFVRLNVTLNF